MFNAKIASMNIDKTTITAMLFGVLMSPFTFLSNINAHSGNANRYNGNNGNKTLFGLCNSYRISCVALNIKENIAITIAPKTNFLLFKWSVQNFNKVYNKNE